VPANSAVAQYALAHGSRKKFTAPDVDELPLADTCGEESLEGTAKFLEPEPELEVVLLKRARPSLSLSLS
jgi:hypothetical protein